MPHRSILSAALLAASLAAQTTSFIAPSGYKTQTGGQGNTIPWWAGSASYQQVHDASDLAIVFGTPLAMIKGLSFRNSGAVPARTLDAQVTLGSTPVTAASATGVFSTNLGPTPTVVLPYTTINLPALSSTANPPPQGWFFMFTTPFLYLTVSGNLCYDLRYKNSSLNTTASCDAVSGSAATMGALFGSGCTATGQTSPATIGARSLDMSTGAYAHRLDRGAANAPAALLFGDTAQHIVVPGFCSALETLPVLTVNGTCDAAGSWNVPLTFGKLYWFPRVTIYNQFLWLDGGLPNGVGVSPCSPIVFPPSGITRIWYGNPQTGQGNEGSTSGSKSEPYPYGLITGFEL